MARFLLVHGAWQGAWCWEKVVPLLEAQGHQAFALDLPGYGADSDRAASATMDDYLRCVLEKVNASQEEAVLVGHCAGAFVSELAASRTKRVRALIYAAGIIPLKGCSMMDLVEQFDPAYLAEIQWASDARSARLSPEGGKKFLYSECQPAIVDSLLPRVEIQSVAPYEYRCPLADTEFSQVPHHYICTLRDRLVPPELQREMILTFGFKNIYSLDSDHSPFFSAPEELSTLLHKIAKQY
jgi:pimeloyl-ACP methyl ester carboxylesterase